VQEKLVAFQRDRQQGIVADSGRQTIAQYLNWWLENIVRIKVRPRVYLFYESYTRLYFVPHLGRIQLAKLTPQHVQSMYTSLLERLSPQTVRHCHAVLKTALHRAVRMNLLARSVMDVVEPPRVAREPVRALGVQEVKAFVEAARHDRLSCLYLTAMMTGLRQGELFGLRWRDVDFERRTVGVSFAVQRRKGPWRLVEPKSATSRRTVAIPAFLAEALREHRGRQLRERLAATRWEDHDLVFCSTVGTPLEGTNVLHRSFRKILERAGLPRIRFHDLRHTAASLLLSQGEHPKVVQERLGHSSIALTMDLYSHLIDNMQRQAADKLQEIFGT
jgi:integrase